MTKVMAAKFCGVAPRISEAIALTASPGDYARVIRELPRAIVMRCPDGCGETVVVNLDKRTGPAWRVFDQGGHLTLYPSVWKESGCRAHFVVWNEKILWCDSDDPIPWDNSAAVEAVHRSLPPPTSECRHFEEVAGELGLVPWEALWACQRLEKMGLAESRDLGSRFRLAPTQDKISRLVL